MMRPHILTIVVLIAVMSVAGCALFRRGNSLPEAPGACKEVRLECDSCNKNGILGSRHIHSDCSETCDMICGRREGY